MWFPPQPCVSGRPAPRGRTVTLTVRVCRAERAAAWSRCSRLRYIRADSCHGRSGITRLAVHAASPLLTQEKEDALMLPVHRKHTLINDLFHIGLAFNEWAFFLCLMRLFPLQGDVGTAGLKQFIVSMTAVGEEVPLHVRTEVIRGSLINSTLF